jgi:hypothetical protein
VLGARVAGEDLAHRRQEVVGHGAADAAVAELDHVVLGAALDPAAEQQLAVDAELAELVDDQRQAPPPALATRWRIRLVLPAPRKPVTTVAGIFSGIVPADGG